MSVEKQVIQIIFPKHKVSKSEHLKILLNFVHRRLNGDRASKGTSMSFRFCMHTRFMAMQGDEEEFYQGDGDDGEEFIVDDDQCDFSFTPDNSAYESQLRIPSRL
jgi:hypothetical protein